MKDFSVVCRDCWKMDRLSEMWHLSSGEFMCNDCLTKDNAFRQKYGLSENQLGINPDAKQK